MGIQLGIEDVGNHHSGMFISLKLALEAKNKSIYDV